MAIELWTTGIAHAEYAPRAAERAEAAGWDGMVVVDSQNLSGDPFVALALAAQHTDSLGLGTGVTNPVTRHPAATAAAIASVHAASGGRAELGVGRGDSALAHLGQAPARPAELERFTRLVRSYLRGEAVEFDELAPYERDGAKPLAVMGLANEPGSSRLHWLNPGLPPVPVNVAATGPATLAAAGRSADRVLLAVGADPDRVDWAASVARGAGATKLGAFVNVVAHNDPATARHLGSGGLTTFARFSAMDGQVRAPIDDESRQVLHKVHDSYDMEQHTRAGSPQSRHLTDDFADRFGIMGPPAHCLERLQQLADLDIDRFVVVGPSLDADRDEARRAARIFAEEVLPAVQAMTPKEATHAP